MNAYERRARERRLEAAARRKPDLEERRANTMFQAAALMKRYEEAYSSYYKRACKVTYSSGWFTVHHRKVRADRLLEMARKLEGLAHEQGLTRPEES
jgi:hypothetical protein